MSKTDDEINRQLIFNSGGANPEDYLTPKQLKRYNKNPERFIDIDVDLAMNKEEELKEELERYERQNQEAYDMSIENEIKRKRIAEEADRQALKRKLKGEVRRKQRQDRKQVQSGGNTGEKFIPDKTEDFAPAPDVDMRTGERIYDTDEEKDQFGRLASSIAFETGANTLLDIFSFIPPAQVAGSGVINYIAQRIRGGEFSYGELVASGLASLIPGGAQGTAAAKLAKSTAKGAVSGGVQTTSMIGIDEGRLPTAEELATGAGLGGAFGGLFQTIGNVKQVDDFLYQTKRRLQGGDFVPMDNPFAQGSVGAAKRKPGPKNPEEQAAMEAAGQKNLMKSFQEDPRLGESDEALNEQYQALYKKYDDRTIGDTIDEDLTARQKREKYGRKLKSTDLDLIIQEEGLKGNTIPPEKAQEYVDLVNESRLGKKEYITIDGKQRLRRNNKGFIGTISYLNAVSLGVNPKNLKGQVDVINHISKELGTDAVGLKKIIEGQGGEITFQTEGMKQPVKIRSLPELVKAYMTRLQRYKEIPAFEKGHFFAADNIINDMDINSLTDFFNQLDPEISRSIREQLDDKAIEELIKVKGTDKGVDFYRSLVDGNRKRKNKQDPDKILADLLGTQYGLRESFLTFVYPERSLSNIIPVESKAAFAELYRKELLAEIKGIKADLRNSGQSSIGPATIDQLKLDVARSVAKGMKNNKILEEVILMDDMINKRGMTEQGQAKPLPDDPIKKDPDGLIRGDTPDQ